MPARAPMNSVAGSTLLLTSTRGMHHRHTISNVVPGYAALRQNDFDLTKFGSGFYPQTTFYAIDAEATDHPSTRSSLERSGGSGSAYRPRTGASGRGYILRWSCGIPLCAQCKLRNRAGSSPRTWMMARQANTGDEGGRRTTDRGPQFRAFLVHQRHLPRPRFGGSIRSADRVVPEPDRLFRARTKPAEANATVESNLSRGEDGVHVEPGGDRRSSCGSPARPYLFGEARRLMSDTFEEARDARRSPLR